MTKETTQKQEHLSRDSLKRLNRMHLQGALVRCGASLFMWLIGLVTHWVGSLNAPDFMWITVVVLYLLLINPPTLWLINRTTRRRTYKYVSISINALEIVGYTAILYFLGGIRATHVTPIYAALIAYVGIIAPRWLPFLLAAFCGISFSSAVLLEYVGVLPHRAGIAFSQDLFMPQAIILFGLVASLFVVAFIASYTSMLLRRNRDSLRKKNLELEKQKQALEDIQAQLIQAGKLSSLGELSAGIAHELNQPLMVIRGTSQFMGRGLRKKITNSDELKDQLEIIERNTKRMMNIINHLRAFSREADQDFHSVDINKVIENSFIMVGEQLRLRSIEVKKELDPDLPRILGDGNKLEQVFLNLITNARDAMNGGGTLRITTRRVDANPHQTAKKRPEGIIEVVFQDDGHGIPQKQLNKIFDPFFTTKDVGKGTGLGLSISYGIIKDHGGEIQVIETDANGTTFRVTLSTNQEASAGASKMVTKKNMPQESIP